MTHVSPAQATRVLEAYGLADVRIEPLANVDCAVFRVHAARIGGCPPGQTAVLKIYPEHKQDVDAIQAEVDWLRALGSETQLRVPIPLPGMNGSLIQQVAEGTLAGRRCVLLTWVNGKSLDEELTPARLRRVGRFVGSLHRHSAAWNGASKLSLTRRTFTQRALSWVLEMKGPPPTVSAGEWTVLVQAAERLGHDLSALGEAADVFGFIHSDLYLSNFLFDGNDVGVIDFSDCAWGHYADDIASVLVFLKHPFVGNFDHSQGYDALRDAFLKGYQEVRPLPGDLDSALATYFAARIFLVWTYVHEASEHVSWVPGCVERSRRYLEAYLASTAGAGRGL